MHAYKVFDDCRVEELGLVTKNLVPVLIDSAEDSLSQRCFGIGICRSESDFVEVHPVGRSDYLIWSDRLSPLSWYRRVFGKSRIDKVVHGHARAVEAVWFYMDHSREAFERKYG